MRRIAQKMVLFSGTAFVPAICANLNWLPPRLSLLHGCESSLKNSAANEMLRIAER
jgi:hypothetical protein